jgi:hypothetical protein
MAYDGSRPTTPNPSVLPPFLCHSNEGMPQVTPPKKKPLARSGFDGPSDEAPVRGVSCFVFGNGRENR